MAAKLLHSLADDNPDLHKQIGCMTGIFQLFDRQNMISGRRNSPKRLLPGTQSNCGSMVSTIDHQEKANESSQNGNVNEKQKVPAESFRDSLPSCSSSFSSVEYSKTAQLEASSFSRTNFSESPSIGLPMNQLITSNHLETRPSNLQNVVKGSMYRDVRTSSVKMTNDDDLGHAAKYRDSPRPPHKPKSAEASSRVATNIKQDIPFDLEESLRVLAKLRDAPWNLDEAIGLPRSSFVNEAKHGHCSSKLRDSPRLSCDGRERNRLSFESRNFKSNPKVKELPRLSLDSSEISGCNFNSLSGRTSLSKNSKGSSWSTDGAPDLHSSGNQKRPSNIVAKLMGLETLPDSSMATDTQFGGNAFAKPLESRNLKVPFQTSASQKSSSKHPTSPRWKNPDLITKPIPTSRHPIEAAPWRKLDVAQVPKKSAFRPVKGPDPNSSSFYGEIEKKLKEIEFKQSSKDQRALKQILEAIRNKALLETAIEEQASNFGIQRDQKPKSACPDQNTRMMNQRNRRSSIVVAKAYESPIIIMKPAKLVEKSGVPTSSMIPMDHFPGLHKLPNEGFPDGKKGSSNGKIKARSPKNSQKDSVVIYSEKRSISRNVISPQTSSKSQLVPKESTLSSIKSSDSVSPRLRQKRAELEKRSHPPTPPSDSNKPRRKTKQKDLNSHCGKIKSKSSNIRQYDDQSSEISNESRTLSYQSDKMTQQSDTNVSLDSKADIEVSSSAQSTKISESQRQPMKVTEFLTINSVKKLSKMTSSEDGSMIEQDTISLEHPSPVSVLDASLYRDDETSPIKQIRSTLEGDESLDSNERHGDEDECNLADSILDGTTGLNHNSEMDGNKFKSIEDLVEKLRCLNSHHDEAETDYIASLCENTNPDHRYISEILLASGLLLRDLGSGLTTFQVHPSGNPINPELFSVLEKTKGSSLLTKEGSRPLEGHSNSIREKYHRQLIFDAVNEMLVEKLALISGGVPEPWLKPTKLAKKALSGQKILKELCYEIQQFQAKKCECSCDEEKDDLKNILEDDVMRDSGSWTEFHGEVPDVVLDMERLIFKDLVNEITIL